ncbi:hypothetical protein RsoM2USA_2 [Ralstonia phage RsoM2USA]|nr:hypothetical protein RsoM2USA_2 [Ralstonia phage RsoM2USA]
MTTKIAVVKLGARIAWGTRDTSGGNGEARSLINMLLGAGAEVHAYTKVLAKESFNPTPGLIMHQIGDEYKDVNAQDYDALCIINGNINYFGGLDDPTQTIIYDIINNFKGKVFYLYCDPNLTLKQAWPTIEKKPWANDYERKNIEITREDITVISQSYNLDHVKTAFDKTGIRIKDFKQYAFEKFPLMFPVPNTLIESQKEFDLSYGGTMRSGRREKNLIKFYFGLPDSINVELFGKIKAEDFTPKLVGDLRHPTYGAAVKYDEMILKMQKALSHVVIGDEAYEKFEMLNQRIYESILAGCVTFIDSRLDHKKRVYGGNDILSNFLYVSTRDDVVNRVTQLKNDPEFAKQIVDLQTQHTKLDIKEYCEGLVKLIKE